MKQDAVQYVISTNGSVKSRQEIPLIKGYEGIKSINCDYDTISNSARVEMQYNSEISNVERLVESIKNTWPGIAAIKLILTQLSERSSLKQSII